MTIPPAVRIRGADTSDLEALVAFGETVVTAHYEPIIGESAALDVVQTWWTRQHLGTALAQDNVFVADNDEGIVGVMEVGRLDGDPVIWKLYIHSAHRGRGIGATLLHAAVDDLPSTTSQVILAHFAGNQRAAEFYDREGFAYLCTEPSPSEDPAAATVWRALRRDATPDRLAPLGRRNRSTVPDKSRGLHASLTHRVTSTGSAR